MFDVRVFAGGREVNTTTVMATITVMMKFSPHFQTQVKFHEGEDEQERETRRWLGGRQFEEMEEEETEGREGRRVIIGCCCSKL